MWVWPCRERALGHRTRRGPTHGDGVAASSRCLISAARNLGADTCDAPALSRAALSAAAAARAPPPRARGHSACRATRRRIRDVSSPCPTATAARPPGARRRWQHERPRRAK
eukprot:1647384-Prymnesium_polylepis.2